MSLWSLVRAHRSLLVSLLRRELLNRYAGTAGGWLWALLHPLLMLGIYALVFQYVFQVRLPQAAAQQPYVLWVALTLWPWLAFSEGVVRGTTAVQQHAALVKKVAFPHQLLVCAATASAFVVHGAGFVLVLALLSAWGLQVVWAAWPVWLWAWGTLALASFAVALLLGALQVFMRDIEQLLGQAMMVLFYASPVIYPLALVPPALQRVMALNPLAAVLEPLRQASLGADLGHAVGTQALWGWVWPPLLAVILLGVGHAVFARLSPHFEDQL